MTVFVGLWKDDVPQRLQEREPWDWSCLKLYPFWMGLKPPRKISAMTAEVNREMAKHGNCDLVSLDGEIDPENPTGLACSGKEFRVYSNKGRSPLERSVSRRCDQRQDGAEKAC